MQNNEEYIAPGIGQKRFNTYYGELDHELCRVRGMIEMYWAIHKNVRIAWAILLINVLCHAWKSMNRQRTVDNANEAFWI